MKITCLAPALLALVLAVNCACAQNVTPEISALQGVYKDRFDNQMVDGEKYKSEDIFEFVGVRGNAAYIKLHLEFVNGHECNLAGIARQQADKSFLFQDSEIENSCGLQIKFDANDIHFFDDEQDNCRKFCGARGGFSGAGFSRKSRRDIKYMKVILNSAKYKEAVENYDKRQKVAK